MAIDPKWHREQVEKFILEFNRYETYAEVLTEILKRACRIYVPLAIVQARAKSVSSFAEKAARKAFKYADPVNQITDLCGARVITHTQREADRISQFIKDNFDVDEPNSLDVRSRLKEAEFGYLSMHYVVRMKADNLLGVHVPMEVIGRRKAEIQVRTLLQHAWADIVHDRIYKTEINVPQPFRRAAAMLAATLENADGAFAALAQGVDAFIGDYAAYMGRDKMQEEIQIRKTVLANEPSPRNRPAVALSLARIARAADDYETIVDALKPFAGVDCPERDQILLEIGYALCRLHRDSPDGDEYRKGQDFLRQAARPDDECPIAATAVSAPEKAARARALAWLAWSCTAVSGREREARDFYRKAFACDPSNPYILTSFVEYEIFCTGDRDLPAGMEPILRNAVDTCRAHVDVGIELPHAYLNMGRLFLLMGDPYESLAYYAKAIHFCVARDVCVPRDLFDREIEFLTRINHARPLPPEHVWVDRMIRLGKAVKTNNAKATPDIVKLRKRKKPFEEPVVIVAGGADPSMQARMDEYRGLLDAALRGFRGTVISGGSTAGVPGLVGTLAWEYRKEKTKQFETIAYLPKYLPHDAPKDERYDDLIILNDGNGFTPREPLQNWIDLLCAGVHPSDVRVLGINGGSVAAFEYQLALAMGATVGVIESSGRAASDLRRDSEHWAGTNLVQLPEDPMSIRAFVQKAVPETIKPDQVEQMAKRIHEKYVEDNKHRTTDPSMLLWPDLPEGLKESNRQQAVCVEKILRSAGYAVRQAGGEGALTAFSTDEVELMAEMEHGRWNIERLKAGWKYGPTRDPQNKISPYLTPWNRLPDGVKDYDRKAVRDWFVVLKDAGLEIYRP